MAGDLLYTNMSLKFKGAPKVIRVKPHEAHWNDGEFLIGFAGIAGEMISLMDFYMNPEAYGGRLPKTRETKGLVLTKKGIFLFDNPSSWMKVDDGFHAIGSGQTAALGAMHSGASPLDAVKVAAKVDPFTGAGYKSLKL